MTHRDPRRANVSTLDGNVMDSFGGLPDAVRHDMEGIYLRWAPRDWRQAERAAWEWARVQAFTAPLVDAACSMHPATPDVARDVLAFMRERLERNHFPQKGSA
jgi:hypothetical protein